jgi:hypothetical protein
MPSVSYRHVGVVRVDSQRPFGDADQQRFAVSLVGLAYNDRDRAGEPTELAIWLICRAF